MEQLEQKVAKYKSLNDNDKIKQYTELYNEIETRIKLLKECKEKLETSNGYSDDIDNASINDANILVEKIKAEDDPYKSTDLLLKLVGKIEACKKNMDTIYL